MALTNAQGVGPLCVRSLHSRFCLYLFFQCVFDISIQRKTRLTGKDSNLTMDSRGQSDVQNTTITFIGLNSLVFTISQIVIYCLVESLCEFLDTFAFTRIMAK